MAEPPTRDLGHLAASVMRSWGVLVGGALLLVAFLLELLRQQGALPEDGIGDALVLYIQLTLPPTSLIVFILAGALVPPAPFLAGAILGLFDALLITVLVLLEQDVMGPVGELVEGLVPLFGIAIGVGAVVTGVAGYIARYIVRAIRPPRVEVETPPWWPGQGLGSASTSGPGMPPASYRCAGCGASNAISSRFCAACGASLLPPPSHR